MFGFYPRPQPAFYQPSYHSPYYAQQRRRELERALQAQELERRRRARAQYFPYGYDDDDDEEYVTPQQYALLRRKQLDAARLAQAQQQQQRQRAPSPVLPDADTLPPSPSTSSQVPPKPAPTPEQLAAAATTIQTAFRTRRALRAVSSLAHDFALLKSAFAAPPHHRLPVPRADAHPPRPAHPSAVNQ
ncbi:hypothetical protein MIND_00956900 [Mycena indigotica]|uniref:Uncharacterized protein n=1 Tax=Mycena indigotica TaxID=2126181 RepID=A0A8H6SD28_9AGAR|nr:uncharacterized protein MIND_00956900 [Mycena indigotica]KAF7297238.1 hypothetical protein MIND_00956900 [Mycena indigotica]